MKTLQSEESSEKDFPWIVFQLGENQCALSSERVISITTLTEAVTAMPDAPPHIRGLITIRGDAIPLLDLRIMFGQATLFEEFQTFADMLEHRKQDHLHWAEELRNSINNHSEFTLTTDPHKCEFGQWYDNYHDEHSTVRFQLKKIEKPHQKLHHAAVLALEALQISDETEREELLTRIIEEVETQDIPAIVGVLDETVAVLKDNIREQVLVIGDKNHQVGCIVDEVLAVQKLSLLNCKDALSSFPNQQYVIDVAQNENGLILVLDEAVFERSEQNL